MRRLVLVVAVLGAACKKKEHQGAAVAQDLPPPKAVAVPAPAPEPPVEPPRPIEPPKAFAIDKLAPIQNKTVEAIFADVHGVARATAPELGVRQFAARFVHKDGTLDATYGTFRVVFAMSDAPDGFVDDPNRPTGAPLPEVKPAEHVRDQCPTVTFRDGAWSVDESGCWKSKLVSGLKCTAAQLWKRALANGAPDNAVAILEFDISHGFWIFSVTDKVRKVDFRHSYRDDCAPEAAGSGSGSGSAGPRPSKKPNPYN